MGNKELALQKIIGSADMDVSEINASCGQCNKTYIGSELTPKEEKITNEFYHYRLTYFCPEGHTVLGVDV